MKRPVFTFIISLILCASISAEEMGKHLFILSGQSNMERLDPAISFTPRVEAAFGAENVLVVKDAEGGQPIRRWYKEWKSEDGVKGKENGDLYARLMVRVNEAVKGRDFDTVTFVWMQGETDAREGHGKVYADSLNGLIGQLSDDLGGRELNVVIGRISDFGISDKAYPHWNMIRRAQVGVADRSSKGAWVDTDDLNDGVNEKGETIKDDLHYSVEGYKEFGNRLAEAGILLIGSQ